MAQPPSDLVLPPGTRPPKAIPKCPGCQNEFEPGQLIVHFIGAVAPGALKTAPIHFGCALLAAQQAGEDVEAAERMAEAAEEVEAGVEEAKAWVHGDVGAQEAAEAEESD